jgi:aminomethyltransferase
MPIQYTGIVEEHGAVRTAAGLFDLSHMGRVRVQGAGRKAFLQKLLTIDVDKIPPGRCRYTFLLTERGTVIDDLLIYSDREDELLVVNASNREKDLEWMREHLSGDVRLVDQTAEVSLLAVQGPRALAIVKEALGVDPGGLKYYTFGAFGEFMLSRTGYTGEDGFEIFLPSDRALAIWNRILATKTPAVGLGARDTLRTEAGMPLYGNDLDEQTTPLEAGLDFAVSLEKPEFIGQKALKADPRPARRLAGLTMESKRIPRPGCEVFADGKAVGRVTSGTFSPTLQKSIAMAYLPRALGVPGRKAEIDIRGKRESAAVVELPFYRREKT